MSTTRTVSVPRTEVDADKLGFFRFGAVAGGVLVTNEYGEWHHFDDAAFRDFLGGKVAPDVEGYDALAAKGFLRDALDLDHVAASVRRRKRFVGLGPALHVLPLSDASGPLTVEVAKDVIDFAMLSTSTTLELRLVCTGALDLDVLGFVVQYSTEKNRYEGKAITYRLVAPLAALDEAACAWLIDKRFKVRTPLSGALDAAGTKVVAALQEAAVAKKRDGWTVEVDLSVGAALAPTAGEVVTGLAGHGIKRLRLRPVLEGDDAVSPDAWASAYRAGLAAALAADGVVEETAAGICTAATRTDGVSDPELRSPASGVVAYDTRGGIFPGTAALEVDDPSMFQLGTAGQTSYRDATTHPTLRALALASLLECLPGFAQHWAAPYLGVDPLASFLGTGDLFAKAPTSAAVAAQVACVEAVFEILLGDDTATAEALRGWAE
ncbi:MAG: hypothetical protein H6732_14085 [Alphaproteobacteria bacterium]|nr:hypothetical protein [Alphaproteobacteria bacterium]